MIQAAIIEAYGTVYLARNVTTTPTGFDAEDYMACGERHRTPLEWMGEGSFPPDANVVKVNTALLEVPSEDHWS